MMQWFFKGTWAVFIFYILVFLYALSNQNDRFRLKFQVTRVPTGFGHVALTH